jgi:hypothetical protein
LLWNPQNIYSREGLKREGSSVYAFQKPERPFKELKLPRKAKEEVDGPRELGQDEISVAEPSQEAFEPLTTPNPVMPEQGKRRRSLPPRHRVICTKSKRPQKISIKVKGSFTLIPIPWDRLLPTSPSNKECLLLPWKPDEIRQLSLDASVRHYF